MVFVHYLSQEYLGVNGLFGDVLGMLNLAELGIGSAMIFSMYRPAAQNDEKQLARLMNLYRTLYRIVALAAVPAAADEGRRGHREFAADLSAVPPASCHVIPAVLQERHLSGVPEGIYPQGA